MSLFCAQRMCTAKDEIDDLFTVSSSLLTRVSIFAVVKKIRLDFNNRKKDHTYPASFDVTTIVRLSTAFSTVH